MHKVILSLAILAITLFCVPMAMAAPAPQQASNQSAPTRSASQRAPVAKPTRMRHIMRELGLTKTQRARIQQLSRQAAARARAQEQTAAALRTVQASATPGTPAFRTATQQLAIAAARNARKRVLRRATLRVDVYKILTPAQRKRLATLLQQPPQPARQP